MIDFKIEESENKGRFVVEVEGNYAGEMTFSRFASDKIIIDHTGVDNDYAGQGLAKKLFYYAVDYLKQNDMKVIPLCPFVKKMFERHPEFNQMVFRQ